MVARRMEEAIAAAVCLAFGLWLASTVPSSPAMGWDESMHVQLPAARVVLALRAGEIGIAIRALLDCAQYPPVWPAIVSAIQLPLGIGEAAARALTSLAWAGALGFVFAIARGAARATRVVDPRIAGWTALALGMLCPLAASFAGTLFLEVPSALATAFASWAWMRRTQRPSARSELVAGVAIALALFTKWNYGLLLGAAFALDWCFEFAAAWRAGTARGLVSRTRNLVIVPALACAWWFLLPLPGGFEIAAQHRAALAGFLAGNLGATPATGAERILYAATGIATTVRLAALVCVLALVALRGVRTPEIRVLAISALTLLGAPLVHPFFLDRFLVPGLVPLFALAGIGLAGVLPRADRVGSNLARTATLGVLALATLVGPGRDGAWLADRLGLLPPNEPARGYVRQVLADRVRLGAERRLPTNGLERHEHDALLDRIAAEVRPGETVGWLGMSSEISPAVLHLGMLQRGGDGSWFLQHDPPPLDLTYFGVDPGFDDSDMRAYAARFDLILWTDPIDVRERRERAFVTAYRERLIGLGVGEVRELATVPVSRPLRDPLAVRLFACRTGP